MLVSAIIPAYRAQSTIGETVRAARGIAGVAEVIVVDDGSGDGTAEEARRAGADRVISLAANRGKGQALSVGVEAAAHQCVLFLDADLGESASRAGPLVEASEGERGMAIAVFPKAGSQGGFGLARGLAGATIRLLTGMEMQAPLSGQRALSADLVRHVGLAPRFGVETGLTVEVGHLGLPIVEMPLPLEHRHMGRTALGFLHRARQFRDVLCFVIPVGYGLWWPALGRARAWMRTAAWLCALAVALALPALLSPSAGAATGVAMACAAVCWLPALWVSTVWLGLRKRNYLGRLLPAGAGLMLPVIVLPTTWLSAAGPEQRAGALIVVGALGAVGLLDDLFGARRQARGLRGHLLSLLRGRVTTGGVKALGGLAAGLAAAALLDRGRPAVIVLDGVLIALAANFVNLLDLRPGRALKGFGLLSAAVAGVAPSSLRVLGPVLAAAVVAAPAEFGGRVMLGEVGANVLGGAAGLALALALSPWQRLVACGALVVVHVVAECASLTELIGRSRWLTLLDHLGTAHLPPFTPEVARQ